MVYDKITFALKHGFANENLTGVVKALDFPIKVYCVNRLNC